MRTEDAGTGNGVRQEVLDYYEQGFEDARLRAGAGRLELIRTQEVLRRFLPSPPASVLDVGGASGVHAEWLARDGYDVHLVDPVPLHVEQAARLPRATVTVGDARALDVADGSYDAVFLLGPLYHLMDADDRLAAWREAGRAVRPGGPVAGAAISRFASLHDGLFRGALADPRIRRLVRRALADGRHLPPANTPWFTRAYFHHPNELAAETGAAGLVHSGTFAVEGVGWFHSDLDEWLDDPEPREQLLWALRQDEQEPSVLGASSHLLAVARRPGDRP